MSWLVRNWHLKVGALALATVLYTGFVYSGSFTEQRFTGVPVQGTNQPDASYPLSQQLGTVDITYRLANDATERVQADSFDVSVDLSEYDMDRAPQPQSLPIIVREVNPGVEILDFSPKTVAVRIDRLADKEVPVVVERGEVPEGLAIGTPVVSDRTVVATGPESVLGRVERAVARVQIFESGIDVSRQVDLVAVDVDGRQVELVELRPGTVTVEIDVRAVQTSKTVPVRPTIAGAVADGFELAGVTVEPAVVTLFGLPDALAPIEQVSTLPISVAGLSTATSVEAELSLPADTRLASGTEAIVVTVDVVAATATRTFLLGVVCQGAEVDVACLPQVSQVSVTVRGAAATLAGLDAGDLTPFVDVAGLAPGEHQVTANVALPEGVEVLSISPGTVTVQLVPPATPSPSPAG